VPNDPKKPDTPRSGIDVTKVGVGGIVVIPTQIDITQVLQVLDAATNLQNIDQYKQLQPALAKAVGDLKTYLTRQDAQISSLQNQLTSAQTQITTLQNANNDLTNQVAALNAQVTQLKAQLASQPQKALPLHIAQSFKNAMDQIQSDARASGGPQTTITNMQIAVKALVSVQDGATPNTKDAVLVFPDPSTPPDPNLLSTLTVNFSAIPNIKAAAAATGSSSSSAGGGGGSSSSASSGSASSSSSRPVGGPIQPPEATTGSTAAKSEASSSGKSTRVARPAKSQTPGANRLRDKLRDLGRKGSGS